MKVYIHHLNFCQLKAELKENTTWQNVLQELSEYFSLTKKLQRHIKIVHFKCSASTQLHRLGYCKTPPINLFYTPNLICRTKYKLTNKCEGLELEFIIPRLNKYQNFNKLFLLLLLLLLLLLFLVIMGQITA